MIGIISMAYAIGNSKIDLKLDVCMLGIRSSVVKKQNASQQAIPQPSHTNQFSDIILHDTGVVGGEIGFTVCGCGIYGVIGCCVGVVTGAFA